MRNGCTITRKYNRCTREEKRQNRTSSAGTLDTQQVLWYEGTLTLWLFLTITTKNPLVLKLSRRTPSLEVSSSKSTDGTRIGPTVGALLFGWLFLPVQS